MAHPFDWAQKSNVVQLIVGTRSYSVRCNIQNSAERKVYYNEHGRIHIRPPMSHSAFFPTALFMFQPLNKHVDLFFPEDNLGTLSLTAVKTRILSPLTTLAVVCWSSSKEGGCWDVFAGCLAASCEKRSRDTALLDQLLCLEEAPQIKHLPRGQPNETTHGEYAEVENTCIGGF